ncbi:serine/threonine-protein kinase TOUSLED isoform X2 [Selaginella moellendorffii]|uniref:serine/threonine-protein kinase TOUSLED isoform X2 n=1 Tax=Selaginella moellendorffii TaxID=88036 RepID=UPI000D1CF063|nr:serine/threonine-protein kinase TOUSLED isoform X2 [Selaginella moellendorffii]|eukprot:XP_024524727.1 serine/threonine-protein kinase TOUSLED isoform X2 [Selaginella moellendorffii]
MHDNVLLHLSSNSNHSDSLPSKLAKLEARMAGKSIPAAKPLPDASPSSTDSDEDNAGDFMIQASASSQKRKTFQMDESREEEKLDHEGRTTKSSRGMGQRGRGGKAKEAKRPHSPPSAKVDNGNGAEHKRFSEDERLKEDLMTLNARCAGLGEELDKARSEACQYQRTCQQLEKEINDMKEVQLEKERKRLKVVSDLLIAVAKGERQEARLRVRQDSVRLGNVGVMRAGTLLSEVWEDGQALKDIQARLKSLLEQKDAIEKQRKLLKKKQNGIGFGYFPQSIFLIKIHADKTDASESDQGLAEEECIATEEMYRARIFSIKREEENTLRDRERYELEKACFIRELKRIRDEDGSRFNHFPILNKRYALLNLLGKGGFSEVYKAYDMVEYRYVACKLHGLNVQWSEEKKQNYIRHAIREYNIHKSLVHSHIVRLWDIFEIDHNTFCTVLQYCGGKDLDAVLKSTSVLPEREARSIMVQIFSGLVYLNRRSQRVIHYDLKPGNVLFDEAGAAKLTDFGLSKIVEDEVGSQGMELTSQGAGTYWYLPPECFDVNKTPLISSKVDVWSAGVLFYQMLFGKRPFGHDQSQERILREDTITKARKVEFPTRPSVSADAKDFIRRCLSYDQMDRPDVLTAAQDPYLSYVKRKP